MSEPTREEMLKTVVDRIADTHDTDVILYNGPLARQAVDNHIIRQSIHRRKRRNALLLMVTMGGDPDAAYRLARCLQSKYEKFVFYVSGYCKSAGTIVALGAHELVVSDFGELGPLDVQMNKKDELFELQSGLTVMDAITTLNEKAYAAFEQFFISTKAGGTGSITMHTAAEIATQLTTGLFSKLYSQIDPMHVGEAGRAMKIADYYGTRLLGKSENIEPWALNWLITQYPHHGFAIDRDEAISLFKNVREPTPDEFILADLLSDDSRIPSYDSKPNVKFLTDEPPLEQLKPETGDTDAQRRDSDTEEQQPSGDGEDTGVQPAQGVAQQHRNVAKIGDSKSSG